MRRSPLLALLAVPLLLSLTAGAAAARSPIYHAFALHLDGAQEATPTCAPPAVCGDPDARAIMILLVSPARDRLCFATRWKDIDGTVGAAHIHPAPKGVPGPVAVPLFEGAFPGTAVLGRCVSANGAAAAIVADPSGYYVNIHSSVYPAGAVRAQLG